MSIKSFAAFALAIAMAFVGLNGAALGAEKASDKKATAEKSGKEVKKPAASAEAPKQKKAEAKKVQASGKKKKGVPDDSI